MLPFVLRFSGPVASILVGSFLVAETTMACSNLFDGVLPKLQAMTHEPFYDDGKAALRSALLRSELEGQSVSLEKIALGKEMARAIDELGDPSVTSERIAYNGDMGKAIDMQYTLQRRLVIGEYTETTSMGREVHPFVGRVVDTEQRAVGVYASITVEFLGGRHKTDSAEFLLTEDSPQKRALNYVFRVRGEEEFPHVFGSGILAGFESNSRRFVQSIAMDHMLRRWVDGVENFAREAGSVVGYWELVDVESMRDFRRLTGYYVIGVGVYKQRTGNDELLVKFGGRVTGADIEPYKRNLVLADGAPNLPDSVNVFGGKVFRFIPFEIYGGISSGARRGNNGI